MALHRCFSWLRKRRAHTVTSSVGEVEEVKVIGKGLVEEKPRHEETERVGDIRDAAESIARQFEISDDDVRRAVGGFVQQMNKGLQEHGCAIEQLPSYISKVPSGREKGTCLAVDLGGTNIRVCSVTFHGDGTYALLQSKAEIPPALMTAKSSKELFHWVAGAVERFLQQHFPGSTSREKRETFNLGFTFSHAVQQSGVNSGTLIRWSKGFDIDGVVGKDVCALLQDAFIELRIPVKVTALINDTVGTLLTHAYTSCQKDRPILGAVFGTGTNGAYIEKISKITKLDNPEVNDSIMIVNTEWGNFDQAMEYLPRTLYDDAVDAASVNPGVEIFEKRISGMYLGEIFRLAILTLQQQQGIHPSKGVPDQSPLFQRGSIDSSFLSNLESDISLDHAQSKEQIQNWLGVAQISNEVTEALRMIAKAIGTRSARLSAVALGAVVLQSNAFGDASSEESISIGVDGSLVELYPGYVGRTRDALRCIDGIGEQGEKRIKIVITKDGSGVGAALAAHVAATPATTNVIM